MVVDLEGMVRAIKRRLPDARVILFGSRARGDSLKTSDVDLIVVSRFFEGMHFTDRSSLILRILWEEGVMPSGVDVDALCYTPEEFERKRREIGVVREALRYGVEL